MINPVNIIQHRFSTTFGSSPMKMSSFQRDSMETLQWLLLTYQYHCLLMGTGGHAAVLSHDQDILRKERKERKEKKKNKREREEERRRERKRGKERKREKKSKPVCGRALAEVLEKQFSSLLEEKAVLRACARGAIQGQEMSGGIWQQHVTWAHKSRGCQGSSTTSSKSHYHPSPTPSQSPSAHETLCTGRAKSQPASAHISWGLLKPCANPVKALSLHPLPGVHT